MVHHVNSSWNQIMDFLNGLSLVQRGQEPQGQGHDDPQKRPVPTSGIAP